MLTKFDIGQNVNFWQSAAKYISGTINTIKIDENKEICYLIIWDEKFLNDSKYASTFVSEENVFTNC